MSDVKKGKFPPFQEIKDISSSDSYKSNLTEEFSSSLEELTLYIDEPDKGRKAFDTPSSLRQLSTISQRWFQESENRASFFQSMLEQSSDIIGLHDIDGSFLYINSACLRILGYTKEEMLTGEPFQELLREKKYPLTARIFTKAIEEGQARLTFRVRKKDQSYAWLGVVVSPVFDKERKLLGFQSVSRDITEQKKIEIQMQSDLERLEYVAQHDSITGLPNRIIFQDRLRQAIVQARLHGKIIGLLYFDLDGFKRINNTLGHSTGDLLLHLVSQRLLKCITEEDTLTRLSGDEFALLLPSLDDQQMAVRVIHSILLAFKKPFRIEKQEIYLTASIGASFFPDDGTTFELLLKHAYNAMFKAKETGKHTFQLYAPASNVAALEQLAFENQLRKAIEREELLLHYQPQIKLPPPDLSFIVRNEYYGDSEYDDEQDTPEYRIVGAEALVRWNHPELGAISPAKFIPVAESTGMITAIGEWVLREACRQTKRWQEQGLPPIHISVNISPWQFKHSNLTQLILDVLEETQLDPQYLELEITESVLMDDSEKIHQTMEKLHQMGIKIAIDDFGTGYSSLLYLKRFPIEVLKIDRSFIKNLNEDPSDAAITKGIIALAQSLSLSTVAEGVQSKKQLNFLRSLGCHRIQGFIFSQGLPKEEFERLLRRGTIEPSTL